MQIHGSVGQDSSRKMSHTWLQKALLYLRGLLELHSGCQLGIANQAVLEFLSQLVEGFANEPQK